MKNNFDRALVFVLQDEGGNDDDPADHGGRTSRGITQREYDAWRVEQGQSKRDVWLATPGELRTIYHDEYWMPYCDLLPNGIDYMFFDMAVNAGPHRAVILLQRALGVTDDGRVGPITRQAIAHAGPNALVEAYSEQKIRFYQSLHQPRFIRGWLNRVKHVADNTAAMIYGVSNA